MIDGKWLPCRYDSKDIFEKDYPKIDLSGREVKCPGCGVPVSLSRKNVANKYAGWCRKCNRAVNI
ncbi:MAG: hypothetical protein KAR84_05825 [Elusimicrobiales bacterium]|nr:hypothetical protein [Elusimicrobiales bacterium]MCK5583224.1 hypothetical protein [Elusimicrobiales bacterium]